MLAGHQNGCFVACALPIESYSIWNMFHIFSDAPGKPIRQGLRADGIYVCLDVNCSDKLQENQGPLGACPRITL